jgi:hypothetical protein
MKSIGSNIARGRRYTELSEQCRAQWHTPARRLRPCRCHRSSTVSFVEFAFDGSTTARRLSDASPMVASPEGQDESDARACLWGLDKRHRDEPDVTREVAQ